MSAGDPFCELHGHNPCRCAETRRLMGPLAESSSSVRTPAFHVGNSGSNPDSATTDALRGRLDALIAQLKRYYVVWGVAGSAKDLIEAERGDLCKFKDVDALLRSLVPQGEEFAGVEVAYRIEIEREDDGRFFASYVTGDKREAGSGTYAATAVGALAELCATMIKVDEDKSIEARSLVVAQEPAKLTKNESSPSMIDAAEMLWIVLANVSGGDWTQQTTEWQEVAARWRDNYFAALRPAGASPVQDRREQRPTKESQENL